MKGRPEFHTNSKKNKFSSMKLNVILAFGLIFVIVGIFLFAGFLVDTEVHLSVVRSLITTLIGGIILYFALIKSSGSWWLCIGLFLCSTGIFVLLLDIQVFSKTLETLWPLIVIFAGLSAFIAGSYNTKKIRLVFILPAFLITVFGIVFLLFSLDVITKSFFSVAGQWWPIIIIFAGLCLVCTFFLWNKKNPIADTVEEEDDDFSDIDSDGSRGL